MVRVDDDAEIPESGAVFTFGKSRFSDNIPSKFWIRNDSVKQVACGDEHTIIVTGNGRVYVFGNNDWGQLGVGKGKTITKPTVIKSLKHERAICAAGGRSHTLVATETGKVYAFGANGEGQLGLGDTTDRSEPCIINSLEDLPAITVAAGSYHSAIVTNSGKLYIFGSNSEGQLGLDDDVKSVAVPTELQLAVNITSISCGYYHTAVVGDSKVYTFGEKDGGKLGLLEKQLMKGSNRPQCIFSIGEKVVAVSCGGNHSAVVTECGKLYTFGSGLNGQLGLGTMVMETGSPSLVGALDGQIVKAVSCGESHTAIITKEGKLYTCGDGRHGKLGLGNENFSNQFNPVQIKKFSDFIVHEVACGGCHMLVLASKRSSKDAAVIMESEANDKPELSDSQKNSDLGVIARSRRRHRDSQEKDLPGIDPIAPPLQDSDLNSIPNQDAEAKKSDDFLELERELTESSKQIVSSAKDELQKSIDDIDSMLSKSHVVSASDEIVNALVHVKTMATSSTPDNARAEKQARSDEASKESIDKDIEESQDEDEGSSDSEEDEDIVSDTKINAENSQSSHSNQSPKEENKQGNVAENSNTENTSQKKESFLKKIFSFKKKKSKSQSSEKPEKDGDTDSAAISADPITAVTSTESIVSPDESKSTPSLERNAGISDQENSKKIEEKSSEKKVSSAKSVKEKSKSASNHSSKTCRIV